MIPAGTLKYTLTFYKLQIVQSDSGFQSKTRVELFNCRAAKVKNTGKLDVNGKELFHDNQLIFKVRANSLLNENLIVKYNENEFNINFLDVNSFDNSATITLSKINE